MMEEVDKYIDNWIVISISLIALPANILVLYLVNKIGAPFNLGFRLIIAIAFIDILTSIVNIVFGGLEIYYGHDILINNPIFCQSMGFIVIYLLITSGSFIVGLSLDRYMLLCHSKSQTKALVLPIPLITSSITFILGVACASLYGFTPSSGGTYCLPNFFNDSILVKIYYIILFFISCVGLQSINFFFIQILFSRKAKILESISSRNRTQGRGAQNNEYISTEDLKKISNYKKIAFKLIVFIIVYNLCYLSNLIALLWDVISGKPRPSLLDHFTSITLHLTELLNPFLVLFLHSQVNREFSNLINQHIFQKIEEIVLT